MARHLDAIRDAPGAGEQATREHELLCLFRGARVLDVGAGTGDDVRAFARIVGRDGTVIAVDRDPEMLRIARARAELEALPIQFLQRDADTLGLDDGSVDATFSSRLLHHCSAPDRVVAEMVRVTAAGGRVVLSMEPDWDTLVVDVPDRALARRILARRADCFANPWSGRRAFGLLRDAGLRDVGVRAQTIVATSLAEDGQSLIIPWADELAIMREGARITPDEMEDWLAQLRTADAKGRFFAAATFFTAWGTRQE